jgi:hypothetical protein
MEQIYQIPEEMTENLGRNGVFLESCTGDYFGYNREAK